MKIAAKTVVVTGAGSGIGREVALEAVRRGARVAAVDLNPDTLADTARLADGHLSTHVADITDRAAVQELPAKVEAEHGGPADALVHCAGIIQPFVTLTDLDYDAIDRVFAVNWQGTLHLAKTFLPVLHDRPEAHLVNISSMGGFLPVPGQIIYGASKAAVKLLTEGLHAECAGTNVHVTVAFPGAVATNISANSGVALPGAGGDSTAANHTITTPQRAAREILDGVEANAYRVLVGRDARLMDRMYRLSPQRAARLITSKMQELIKG
ncbi:SDR family NAD(P)-dependent oxidoreductase [Actinoplanes sp. NPDC051861]|uniref:SDR family NAD(P)-dependent oxidoreductase n=1 Tax=Actinoplanes sp. NPDC051861 TaxID=3155170 RepID=UPI0034377C4A